MTVVSVQDMVKRIRLLRDTMDTIYEISNLVKKSSKTNADTLAQLFSCEFCKISKNTFPYRTLLVVASECCKTCSRRLALEYLGLYVLCPSRRIVCGESLKSFLNTRVSLQRVWNGSWI